jgi:hypothetical protein
MVHVYREERAAELISQDHDAITAQLPPDADEIAGFVGRLTDVVGVSLAYGGREFSLSADAKMGLTRNKRSMVKVTADPAQVRDALERVMRNGAAPQA